MLSLFVFFFHAENGMRFWFAQMMMSAKGKRLVLVESDILVQEEGMSSESVTNVCSSGGGTPPSLEDDSSDTSLKLG